MTTPETLATQLSETYQWFCEALAWLEPDEIEAAAMGDGWTPKALVAHVAFWDDYQTRRMQAALSGASATAGFARPAERNEARRQQDRTRPWPAVAETSEAARQRMVDFVRGLSAAELAATYQEGGNPLRLQGLVQHMVQHTREHLAQLQQYCGSMQRWQRDDLYSFMETQHANLLDSIAGLTEATMLSAQVCGIWTIRDVLAHVLSWNE